MSNDKAEILTEAEVNGLSDYVWSPRIISTIRQMAGLLEAFVLRGPSSDRDPRWDEAAHILARYKGERTS